MIFFFPRQWAPGVGEVAPFMGGTTEPTVVGGGVVVTGTGMAGAVVTSEFRMGAASVEGSARIKGGVVS